MNERYPFFGISALGWAEEGVIQTQPSPKHSSRKGFAPIGVVIHWTGGTSFSGAVRTLVTSKRKVSCHFMVGTKPGEILQAVSIRRCAWHAGLSKLPPNLQHHVTGFNEPSVNRITIGVECVHPGWMTNGVSYFRTPYHRMEWQGITRHFFEWPPQLVTNLYIVLRSLGNQPWFPLQFAVGHDTVSPGRKWDPGPLLPYDLTLNDPLRPRSDGVS